MTNEKIRQLILEVSGFETFPETISENTVVFQDSSMLTFAERIIEGCIAAVDTGDANTNSLVADQIRAYYGVTPPAP